MLPVETEAKAWEILRRHRLRWRIKAWHRVLKAGCWAEEVAFRTAARIKKAAATSAAVAWRLAAPARLGRQTPGLDADLMFSEAELAVLGDFARIRRARRPETLSHAMTLAAMLGGYQLQWDGQFRLAQRAQVVEDMKALGEESGILKLVSSGEM